MKMQFGPICRATWALAGALSCVAPVLAAPPKTMPARDPNASQPVPSAYATGPLEINAGAGVLVRLNEDATSRVRRRPGRGRRARALAASSICARKKEWHYYALRARPEQQDAHAAHRLRSPRHGRVAQDDRRAFSQHECANHRRPGLIATFRAGHQRRRCRRCRAGRHALSGRQGSARQPHDDRPAVAGAVARADHGSGPQRHAATGHQLAVDRQCSRQFLRRHLQRPRDLQPEPAGCKRRAPTRTR